MKYIVYLTTNLVNNKIYVGVHGTENPEIFDGYLGNSINRFTSNPELKHPKLPLHKAIKKYGYDAFRRITILEFDTLEEALELEGNIVNEQFLQRSDVYNVTLGGGLPPLHNKKVYQYTLKGIYIKEWDSLAIAAESVLGFGNLIGLAALHKFVSYNYYWSFEKVEQLDLSLYTKKLSIPVYLYDSNKKFVRFYESMNECCRDLNTYLSKVLRAVVLGIPCNGFYISKTFYAEYISPKIAITQGPIHLYTLDGKYLKTYLTKDDLPKEFNEYSINRNIKEGKTYQGYIWIRGEKRDSVPSRREDVHKISKIGLYTMDGKLVKIFDTLRECRKEFPNVSRVLSGKAKHCHNFFFKRIS